MFSMNRRLCAGVIALGIVAVGCGGSDGSASETTTAFTLLPPTSAPETSSTTTSTTSTTTSTLPATTSTSLVAPTTTVADPAVNDLILSGDGIGTAGFGADPDGVMSYMSSYLGDPTNDTGWVDPFSIGTCPGTELRRVSWGVLTVLFGDASSVAQGRRHFFGYTYGDQAEIGASPAGLTTSRGVVIGSRVVDLRAAYPAVQIFPEDDFFPPSYVVNDNLRGFLTGVTDDATVTAIVGGDECGSI
jgi:hypothetical protein